MFVDFWWSDGDGVCLWWCKVFGTCYDVFFFFLVVLSWNVNAIGRLDGILL